MTDYIKISSSSPKTALNQGRWQLFLVLGLLANAAIWTSALLFLKTQKTTYTSTLTATLPGAGSGANVSLPNIGQASYESSSPYANSAVQDPRETYKIIAQSEPVLKAAANKLNISPESFGEPRVNIVLNSTVMTFEFKGASTEESRNKSLALYQAVQARLNELRSQELTQRDASLQTAIGSAKTKLDIAQNRLSAYKGNSALSSNEQPKELADNIEQLRKQQAETLAQQQQASARLKQISVSLNLSPQQAADAFVLQTDQIFQQNLKDYSESSATLVVLGSKLLPNHPTIVAEKAKQNAAQIALLKRSEFILGRPVTQAALKQLNLNSTSSSSGRENLFEEVIKVQAEQRALQAEAQEIGRQLIQLEARLKTLVQQESTLDALQRDLKVAEAVFSSTLTKLDIGRSNVFGSYPLLQILAEPSFNETPSSPKKKFVLLGATLGSLFLTTGLVSLWLRQSKTGIPEQIRSLRRKLHSAQDN